MPQEATSGRRRVTGFEGGQRGHAPRNGSWDGEGLSSPGAPRKEHSSAQTLMSPEEACASLLNPGAARPEKAGAARGHQRCRFVTAAADGVEEGWRRQSLHAGG